MITKKKVEIAVKSKLGYLVEYYSKKYSFTTEQSYCYIRDTGIVDILKSGDNRLFLESVELIIDAIDIFYSQGKEQMYTYLKDNIGG